MSVNNPEHSTSLEDKLQLMRKEYNKKVRKLKKSRRASEARAYVQQRLQEEAGGITPSDLPSGHRKDTSTDVTGHLDVTSDIGNAENRAPEAESTCLRKTIKNISEGSRHKIVDCKLDETTELDSECFVEHTGDGNSYLSDSSSCNPDIFVSSHIVACKLDTTTKLNGSRTVENTGHEISQSSNSIPGSQDVFVSPPKQQGIALLGKLGTSMLSKNNINELLTQQDMSPVKHHDRSLPKEPDVTKLNQQDMSPLNQQDIAQLKQEDITACRPQDNDITLVSNTDEIVILSCSADTVSHIEKLKVKNYVSKLKLSKYKKKNFVNEIKYEEEPVEHLSQVHPNSINKQISDSYTSEINGLDSINGCESFASDTENGTIGISGDMYNDLQNDTQSMVYGEGQVIVFERQVIDANKKINCNTLKVMKTKNDNLQGICDQERTCFLENSEDNVSERHMSNKNSLSASASTVCDHGTVVREEDNTKIKRRSGSRNRRSSGGTQRRSSRIAAHSSQDSLSQSTGSETISPVFANVCDTGAKKRAIISSVFQCLIDEGKRTADVEEFSVPTHVRVAFEGGEKSITDQPTDVGREFDRAEHLETNVTKGRRTACIGEFSVPSLVGMVPEGENAINLSEASCVVLTAQEREKSFMGKPTDIVIECDITKHLETKVDESRTGGIEEFSVLSHIVRTGLEERSDKPHDVVRQFDQDNLLDPKGEISNKKIELVELNLDEIKLNSGFESDKMISILNMKSEEMKPNLSALVSESNMRNSEKQEIKSPLLFESLPATSITSAFTFTDEACTSNIECSKFASNDGEVIEEMELPLEMATSITKSSPLNACNEKDIDEQSDSVFETDACMTEPSLHPQQRAIETDLTEPCLHLQQVDSFQVSKSDHIHSVLCVEMVYNEQLQPYVVCLCSLCLKLFTSCSNHWTCVATTRLGFITRKKCGNVMSSLPGTDTVSVIVPETKSDCTCVNFYTYSDHKWLHTTIDRIYCKSILVCPLSNHHVIISYYTDEKTYLSKYWLNSESGRWSSIQLASTDTCISHLLAVRGIDDAVVALTKSAQIQIWNHERGYLLSTLDILDVSPSDPTCPTVFAEQGFLFLPLLNQKKSLEPGSVVVINPFIGTSETLTSMKVQGAWTGCSNVCTMYRGLILCRQNNGCVRIWNVYTGSLLATINDVAVTCCTAANQHLVITHKQCVHVYKLNI